MLTQCPVAIGSFLKTGVDTDTPSQMWTHVQFR